MISFGLVFIDVMMVFMSIGRPMQISLVNEDYIPTLEALWRPSVRLLAN